MSPLRWITPSQLVICLILFFLPWIEIQCPMPKDFKNPNPNANMKFDPKDVDWTPFIRQSGWQAATGNYSLVDPTLQKMMDQQADKKEKEKEKDKPDMAPLLLIFLFVVIVGILVGFIFSPSPLKKGVLAGCCLLALATAGAQAAAGFPITKQIKEQSNRDAGKMGNLQLGTGEMLKSSLQISLYLTLLFTVGALVTTVLEPVRKPKKKKRVVIEEEDEEIEDEEEGEPPPKW